MGVWGLLSRSPQRSFASSLPRFPTPSPPAKRWLQTDAFAVFGAAGELGAFGAGEAVNRGVGGDRAGGRDAVFDRAGTMEADIVEQALFGGGDSRFHGRRDFAGKRVRDGVPDSRRGQPVAVEQLVHLPQSRFDFPANKTTEDRVIHVLLGVGIGIRCAQIRKFRRGERR